MFVRNDCKTFRFCRGKCHKHFKMKHNPRKLKWTKASRKLRGKEMVMDRTFEFEKKRNTPVRYNRNLWIKTIQAMKKIDVIRQNRKVRFHKQRLAEQLKARIPSARKEIAKNKDLMSIKTVKTKVKKKIVVKEGAVMKLETKVGAAKMDLS